MRVFNFVNQQKMHDWMLGLMVLCFVVIDVVMLVVFSAVEGAQGELGADRVLDEEYDAITEGVRIARVCSDGTLTPHIQNTHTCHYNRFYRFSKHVYIMLLHLIPHQIFGSCSSIIIVYNHTIIIIMM